MARTPIPPPPGGGPARRRRNNPGGQGAQQGNRRAAAPAGQPAAARPAAPAPAPAQRPAQRPAPAARRQPASAPTVAPTVMATPGNAQVVLSWTRVPGASSYNVRFSTTRGGQHQLIASGVRTTAFTHTGLTNGTAGYYTVAAQNAAGEGPQSGEVAATPVAPGAPVPTPAPVAACPPARNANWGWVPAALTALGVALAILLLLYLWNQFLRPQGGGRSGPGTAFVAPPAPPTPVVDAPWPPQPNRPPADNTFTQDQCIAWYDSQNVTWRESWGWDPIAQCERCR